MRSRERRQSAERRCACGADISDLPSHFRHCRACYRQLRDEARHDADDERDEDFWDGEMHRLLTGID